MLTCSIRRPVCLRSRAVPAHVHPRPGRRPHNRRFYVRKMMVGLVGVAVVAGMTTVASSALAQSQAQPQAKVPAVDVGEPMPADDLPSADGLKERELRQVAVQGVLNGTLTPQKINGSTVVKLGSSEAARSRGAS